MPKKAKEVPKEPTGVSAVDRSAIKRKIFVRFGIGLVAIAALLFVPAGTLDYWQAWLLCAILVPPMILVLLYFWFKDPEVLERRMSAKETESKQKYLVAFSLIPFMIGLLIPGLDHRFGWSQVPLYVVLTADFMILLGYALFFLVLRENHYASRTIQVERGQKVISTGPYAVVRHPMYVATLLIWLSMPIALGSYWAFIPFLAMPAVLVFRILNEEEVLKRELPGYSEYCKKTKYRMVPFVW